MTICWLGVAQPFAFVRRSAPRATAGTRCGAVGDIIGERGVNLLISSPNAPHSGTQNFGSDLPRWPIASRSAAQRLASENQPIERR
jgi:hypothetical protein